MSKIDIEYKLTSKESNISKKLSGILNDNRIVYIDDNIKTSIILDNIIILKRETDEYIINLVFDNSNSSKYILLNYNQTLPLDLKVIEIINRDNYLKLKYQLNNQSNIYELELKYKKI